MQPDDRVDYDAAKVADVVDAIRTDLVTYHGLMKLKEPRAAWEVSERIHRRLALTSPRLKDELIVALISRQAMALAHKMVTGGQAEIAALTSTQDDDR